MTVLPSACNAEHFPAQLESPVLQIMNFEHFCNINNSTFLYMHTDFWILLNRCITKAQKCPWTIQTVFGWFSLSPALIYLEKHTQYLILPCSILD